MDAAGPSDRREMPIRYFTVGGYAIFGSEDGGTFGTLATFLLPLASVPLLGNARHTTSQARSGGTIFLHADTTLRTIHPTGQSASSISELQPEA